MMNVSCRCALTLSLVACSSEMPAEHAAVPVVDAAILNGRCRERQCLAPAGTFVMGSPDTEFLRGRYGEAQRDVTLTRALAVDQFEVTQAEWESYGYPNRAGTQDNGAGGTDCTEPSCPAASLTWADAVAYANERSRREGRPSCVDLSDCTGTVGVDLVCRSYRQTTASYYDCGGYRLPTLAEFQYVARAGTTTAFYSGPFEPAADSCVKLDHLMAAAWHCANSGTGPTPWGGALRIRGGCTTSWATPPSSRRRARMAWLLRAKPKLTLSLPWTPRGAPPLPEARTLPTRPACELPIKPTDSRRFVASERFTRARALAFGWSAR